MYIHTHTHIYKSMECSFCYSKAFNDLLKPNEIYFTFTIYHLIHYII